MNVPVFSWLVLIPVLGAPLVYVAGRLWRKVQWVDIGRWLALIVLAMTWTAFVATVHDFGAGADRAGVEQRVTLGAVALELDGLGLLLAAITLALGTLVVLYSGPVMAHEAGREKYYAMLVALIGVMIGLGLARDLFNLWLWFEAMAVSSYLLVAFYREERASLEAGVKYLVQSATGSALVLIGIALVLGQTGTLDLERIRAVASASPTLLAAGALFVIGFGVKAALVPLHTWLPDAHAQAPSGISAMLSGVVIEAGLIALLRVLMALAGVTPSWGLLLLGFGALNMLLGNLLALRQTQVKRLLAFSSLSHVGYMLLGLGIGLVAGESAASAGAQGGFFHLLNHGLMKGLAFLAAGAVIYALHTTGEEHKPLMVKDLTGVAQRYPLVALALSLALLGLAGLPPLAGFMSKWQIFVAGFETENTVIGALVIFAALNSVLSLAYYVPLVNALYRSRPAIGMVDGRPLPVSMSVSLAVLAVAIVAVGVWPNLLSWLTGPAGRVITGALGE
jgi:proton-translocating NADH-quinone oxidoreductase chain N